VATQEATEAGHPSARTRASRGRRAASEILTPAFQNLRCHLVTCGAWLVAGGSFTQLQESESNEREKPKQAWRPVSGG